MNRKAVVVPEHTVVRKAFFNTFLCRACRFYPPAAFKGLSLKTVLNAVSTL